MLVQQATHQCNGSFPTPILASGHAKPQVEVPGIRSGPEPVRRPRVVGGVAPAPAPKHADSDPRRARRIDGWRFRIVFVIPSVPAPLPDIPVHVEQPPAVWQLAPAGSRPTGVEYCIFPQHLLIASAGKFGRRAGATRVLPFGLSRQAVAGRIGDQPPGFVFHIPDFLFLPGSLIACRVSLLTAQPVAEEHGVVPVDHLNRVVRSRALLFEGAFPLLWFLCVRVLRIADELLELPDADLPVTQVERPRQFHRLVFCSRGLIVAHKLAGVDLEQRHAQRIDEPVAALARLACCRRCERLDTPLAQCPASGAVRDTVRCGLVPLREHRLPGCAFRGSQLSQGTTANREAEARSQRGVGSRLTVLRQLGDVCVPCRQLIGEDRALDRIAPIVDAAHVGGDAVVLELERHDSQAGLETPVLLRRGFFREVVYRLRRGLSRPAERVEEVGEFFGADPWTRETSNGTSTSP